jgi:hypothetical protein
VNFFERLFHRFILSSLTKAILFQVLTAGSRFNIFQPAPLQISWNIEHEEIIYEHGQMRPLVYPMYNIHPKYGHFIWWDEATIKTSMPVPEREVINRDLMLQDFKDIVAAGRVQPAIGAQGIVRCHGEQLKKGDYKIKSFQVRNAASQYRIFCRLVSQVIVNGIQRNLYQAYLLEKEH